MTIAFIRHGQTDWNAAGRMQGTSDIPLNDVGRGQARDAVAVLGDFRPENAEWDVIVSSPLGRARETAAIIAEGLGIELGSSYDLLVERHYGEAEGLTAADIRDRWGEGRDYPGLESLDSVVERGKAALELIAEEYRGRNVVIVCHGTIIRYTLADLAGRPLDQIVNGSVSTLEHDGSGWRVTGVNSKPLDALV
ncbi:putative phosphoglycerate mutase [Homoserinimonas aerilata]|uniref:Putative phosphoglycerate mutase n=1 Tax=Homoserinimonas aerilata TaxID=1162970 RepID=A0A542YHN9_9MICO|nr:histidine phosphatase family protein [Homoserinimonas aerilata]TQL47592.1 putative phosphoglycerate mutase [Homoserinimonas aerilata]